MAGYAHITRCAELTEGDIVGALGDRRLSKVLLERLAKVARPGEGAPKVLHLLARMAGKEVDWIEGVLRVEIGAEGDGVVIDVLSDLGAGMQERLFPSLKMGAPFKEFARMAEHMPRTLEPLIVVKKATNRMVLEAPGEERLTSMPQAVAIADESLYRGGRRTTRPKVGPGKGDESGEMPKRASSGKLRAAPKRPSSEVDVALPKISAQSGATIRPALMAAPAPARSKTLRPDTYAMPPPIPAVPQAPRVPRVDPGESGSPAAERVKLRRGSTARMSAVKVAPPAPAPVKEERKSKKTSRPKVDPSAEATGRGSARKLSITPHQPTEEDFDWDIPPTGMPPASPPSKRRGTHPDFAMPPQIPGPPLSPRIPRVEADEPGAARSERGKARRTKSSAKSVGASTPPKNDRRRSTIPRSDDEEE
jgi:hypothetical protein